MSAPDAISQPSSSHPRASTPARPLRSFASTDRFVAELGSSNLRPGYVLVGDETFLLDRCRQAVLSALVPPDLRDLCLYDLDLAETSVFDILDRGQTPSLMAPFQVLWIRNLKLLYTRGAKKDEFAAIDAYFRSPNPQALLVFVADHLHLPADLRRIDMQDKDRFDRLRETLGDHCPLVELAQVGEDDAAQWLIATAAGQGALFESDAARELTEALGADMMSLASELEKLLLYTGARPRPTAPPEVRTPSKEKPPREIGEGLLVRITRADVETMVLAAKQSTLYELTDAISAHDCPRAVMLLHGLLNSSDSGEDAAIGHLYMLARTFRQMLIILEKNVRDSRAIWQALWQGFRMPPFAADELIRQARRYKSRRELTRALRLIARADLELRSSPVSKLLVLERLVLALSSEPGRRALDPSPQFAMEL